MHSADVLRRPVVTEKTTEMQDGRRYVFEVAKSATKFQIKLAVEEAFNVKVLKVNTMMVRGKRKKLGPRFSQKPSWKKAMVTIGPGQTITIFEGV